ncbi:MAG: ADP-ribosylation factor-like protein [Candidatus Helarchaeota archaeon]
MIDVEKKLLQKALGFFKNEVSEPRTLEDLSSLPCYTLKGITEEISGKLRADLNITNIQTLANYDHIKNKELLKKLGFNIFNFEKWVLAARVITRISNYEVTETKKLALLGLENAGKTAVREILLRKYKGNTLIFDKILRKLQPTKGIEREEFSILDNPIQLWDMGGQEIYRDNYLKEPERFLLGINVVIYLIDVQDKEKHNQTIEYIKQLASTFHTIQDHPVFLVCYHKMDPDIENKQKYWDWIENSWKIISLVLKEHGFKSQRFVTSIYDDITIFKVFSEALKVAADYDIGRMINALLAKYAQETKLDNLILFDSNGLKLGEYIQNDRNLGGLLELIYQFAIYTLHSINQIVALDPSIKMKTHIKDVTYTFYAEKRNFLMTRLLLLDRSLYLATFHLKKIELDTSYIKKLLPWLSNLFS